MVDVFVKKQYHRWSSEEEDQYAKRNEPIDGHDIVVDETMPWAHCAKPDEDGDVEQQVYAWLQAVILRFDPKPVVPCKDIAGHETGKNIIRANQAAGPDDEELSIRQNKVLTSRPC